MNKKYLMIGLPILFGVVLVSALIYVAYHHEFTKNINVFNEGSGQSEVQILGFGDISSSTINCDNTFGECNVESGDITLRNGDSVSHDCTITTTGEGVTVSYTGGIVEGINSIPVGDTVFKIQYASNTTGQHPMKTIIDCPTQ